MIPLTHQILSQEISYNQGQLSDEETFGRQKLVNPCPLKLQHKPGIHKSK